MAEAVSLTEGSLLARDQVAQPWHVSTVLVLERPITKEELVARIADRIGFAPRFRQRLGGLGGQTWVDDTGFRVQGHVRERVLADGQLSGLLSKGLNERLFREHPLWDVTLADGLPGGRQAVVVRVHPALVDGFDHVHLLQELLDAHPEPVGEPPHWTPTPEPGFSMGGLLGRLSDPLQVVSHTVAGVTNVVEAGVRQAVAEPKPRHVAAIDIDLAKLRAARDRWDCTIHDVLISLATAGLRGWQHHNHRAHEDAVALVPLAVTERAGSTSAMGCAVAPQCISLPVGLTRAGERVQHISTLTLARMDSGRSVPATQLADQPGFTPPTVQCAATATIAEGRLHTVFIANTPGPAQRRFLGDIPVLQAYHLPSTVDDQQLSVGILGYAGRVTMTACAVAPLTTWADDVWAELTALLKI